MNRKGMTLTNILVAIALAGVASSVLLYIQTIVNKNLSKVSNQSSLVLLESDVMRITENPRICAEAFWSSGVIPAYLGTTIPLSEIKIGNMPVAKVGAIFDRGVKVDSIEIVSKSSTGIVVANAFRRWDADLKVEFSDISGSTSSKVVKTFPLSLRTVGSSGRIEACGRTEAVSTGAALGYSCDMNTGMESPNVYSRTVAGKVFRVMRYAYFTNPQIHDGGKSGSDDTATYYCVQQASDLGRNGSLGVCISKEACVWR
ncbi:MAG: hypothetical protein J7501_13900 [Bdellovibrio sp.]|nr:hypothetical protein [Bdellovibrio sp.]